MKFFATTLLAASSAMAFQLGTPVEKRTTHVERDAAAISSAIAAISAATTQLDSAITGFSGASSASGLQSASDAVLSAINAGNSAALASATLTQDEGFSLAQPIQDLGTLVNTTVTNAINKKNDFVAANVGGAVLSSLQAQQSASQTFSTNVIAKLPEALKGPGNILSQPILQALAAGVAAFSDQMGMGGGSSSSSSAAAATSTAAASSSAAATTAMSSMMTSASATMSMSAPVATYTGAASHNAAGLGAIAIAAAAAVIAL